VRSARHLNFYFLRRPQRRPQSSEIQVHHINCSRGRPTRRMCSQNTPTRGSPCSSRWTRTAETRLDPPAPPPGISLPTHARGQSSSREFQHQSHYHSRRFVRILSPGRTRIDPQWSLRFNAPCTHRFFGEAGIRVPAGIARNILERTNGFKLGLALTWGFSESAIQRLEVLKLRPI